LTEILKGREMSSHVAFITDELLSASASYAFR